MAPKAKCRAKTATDAKPRRPRVKEVECWPRDGESEMEDPGAKSQEGTMKDDNQGCASSSPRCRMAPKEHCGGKTTTNATPQRLRAKQVESPARDGKSRTEDSGAKSQEGDSPGCVSSFPHSRMAPKEHCGELATRYATDQWPRAIDADKPAKDKKFQVEGPGAKSQKGILKDNIQNCVSSVPKARWPRSGTTDSLAGLAVDGRLQVDSLAENERSLMEDSDATAQTSHEGTLNKEAQHGDSTKNEAAACPVSIPSFMLQTHAEQLAEAHETLAFLKRDCQASRGSRKRGHRSTLPKTPQATSKTQGKMDHIGWPVANAARGKGKGRGKKHLPNQGTREDICAAPEECQDNCKPLKRMNLSCSAPSAVDPESPSMACEKAHATGLVEVVESDEESDEAPLVVTPETKRQKREEDFPTLKHPPALQDRRKRAVFQHRIWPLRKKKKYLYLPNSSSENATAAKAPAIPTVKPATPDASRDSATLQGSVHALKRMLEEGSAAELACECIQLAQSFAQAGVGKETISAGGTNALSRGTSEAGCLGRLAMLVAIPPLLDLAIEDPLIDAELRAKEILINRLERDFAFAANFISEHACGDVSSDLQELERAAKKGSTELRNFSSKLYNFKIRIERDVHVALVRESIASLRTRAALLLAAKERAVRWAYAELAWHGCGLSRHGVLSVAAAAEVGKESFSGFSCKYAPPKLLAAQLASCDSLNEWVHSLADVALQRQIRSLVTRLFTEMQAMETPDSSAAKQTAASARNGRAWALRAVVATGIVQALTEAELEQGRCQQEELKASLSELQMTNKSAELSLAAHAEGTMTQLLEGEEVNMAEIRGLLGRLNDKRFHGEVVRELRLEVKRKAEEKLLCDSMKLEAVEKTLQKCTVAMSAWESLAEVLDIRNRMSAFALVASDEPVNSSAGDGHLSATDWARLDDGKHLNDALVDLFVNLLSCHLGGPSVHSFSSQFFDQLCSRNAENGAEGWQHVRTWTRSARRLHPNGIFGHDFVFVPVNVGKSHWILAVICYHATAGKSANESQPDEESSHPGVAAETRIPSVVFLDSLGGTEYQAHVLHFLRGYLACEWADCVGGTYDCEKVQGVHVDVPQQKNTYDCGIFVLEFVLQLLRKPGALAALAAPQPKHCLAVASEPRRRWQRAGNILRTAGDEGIARALAELCDEFDVTLTSPEPEQPTSSASIAPSNCGVSAPESPGPCTPQASSLAPQKPEEEPSKAPCLLPFNSPRRSTTQPIKKQHWPPSSLD